MKRTPRSPTVHGAALLAAAAILSSITPHPVHPQQTEATLWSDVLTADAAEAFTGAGGFYDAEVARRLRDHVFSVGNTVDPADGYRGFRGRDPAIEPLMRKRGFPAD